MTVKRLWHTIRISLTRGGTKRADYCRKHHVFHHVGKGCSIQTRKIPLYSELISFGNNVRIGTTVSFITHDIIHSMINNNNNYHLDHPLCERLGCIEVGDNVFIGAHSTVLFGVRIGSNTIIAANSVVTKDLQPNYVYGGVPARKIKPMDDFLKDIQNVSLYPEELKPSKQRVSSELVDYLWEDFYKKRT